MEEATQLTPVSLNKEIVGLFFRLSKADSEEASTLLLTEIHQLLGNNKNIINPATFAMLFHQLGSLDNKKQALAKKLILFAINQASISLKKHSREFNAREITQIINALHKLPITWSQYPQFVTRLLKRFYKILDAPEDLNDVTLINILCVLAKLGFLVPEPLPLLLKVLDVLKLTEEKIKTLMSSSSSQLWQFCVYAKSRFETEERITQLFTWIDSHIREFPPPPGTSSEFHLDFVDFLRKHIKKKFLDELQSEYIAGAYALDIVFLSLKLNIEIDGNAHYRGEHLLRKDRFRDFVLEYYDQWTIARIILREFTHLKTQDKLNYLREKLGKFDYILKPFAPNVTQGLAKHQLLKNKSAQNSNIRPSKPTHTPTAKK